MMEKVFELGERRRVTMEIWLHDGAQFTPTNCTWALMTSSNMVEQSGACEALPDGTKWRLTCEVQPKQRYRYKLQYTFGLGTEIIKRSVDIRVV